MDIFAQIRAGVVTESPEEMRELGSRLAPALPPETTLALHGDMGAGKTTFVQGLAQGLGVTGAVTSPTFNIFHLYRGSRTLVHLDAYRLETARQMSELMIEDFLTPPWCLAVEWPEKIAEWLPAGALRLALAIESPGRRRIVLRRE